MCAGAAGARVVVAVAALLLAAASGDGVRATVTMAGVYKGCTPNALSKGDFNGGVCVSSFDCQSFGGHSQDARTAVGCDFDNGVFCCTQKPTIFAGLDRIGARSDFCDNKIFSNDYVGQILCGKIGTIIDSSLLNKWDPIKNVVDIGSCSTLCKTLICAQRVLGCKEEMAKSEEMAAQCSDPSRRFETCAPVQLASDESGLCEKFARFVYKEPIAGQSSEAIFSHLSACNDPIDTVSLVFADQLGGGLGALIGIGAPLIIKQVLGDKYEDWNKYVGPCTDLCRAALCMLHLVGCEGQFQQLKTTVDNINRCPHNPLQCVDLNPCEHVECKTPQQLEAECSGPTSSITRITEPVTLEEECCPVCRDACEKHACRANEATEVNQCRAKGDGFKLYEPTGYVPPTFSLGNTELPTESCCRHCGVSCDAANELSMCGPRPTECPTGFELKKGVEPGMPCCYTCVDMCEAQRGRCGPEAQTQSEMCFAANQYWNWNAPHPNCCGACQAGPPASTVADGPCSAAAITFCETSGQAMITECTSNGGTFDPTPISGACCGRCLNGNAGFQFEWWMAAAAGAALCCCLLLLAALLICACMVMSRGGSGGGEPRVIVMSEQGGRRSRSNTSNRGTRSRSHTGAARPQKSRRNTGAVRPTAYTRDDPTATGTAGGDASTATADGAMTYGNAGYASPTTSTGYPSAGYNMQRQSADAYPMANTYGTAGSVASNASNYLQRPGSYGTTAGAGAATYGSSYNAGGAAGYNTGYSGYSGYSTQY